MPKNKKKQCIKRIISLFLCIIFVLSVPAIASADTVPSDYLAPKWPASEEDRSAPDMPYRFNMSRSQRCIRWKDATAYTMKFWNTSVDYDFKPNNVDMVNCTFSGHHPFVWANNFILDSALTDLDSWTVNYVKFPFYWNDQETVNDFKKNKERYFLKQGEKYTVCLDYQIKKNTVKYMQVDFYFVVVGYNPSSVSNDYECFIFPAALNYVFDANSEMGELNIENKRTKLYWDFRFDAANFNGYEEYFIGAVLFDFVDNLDFVSNGPEWAYKFGIYDFYISEYLPPNPLKETNTKVNEVNNLYQIDSSKLQDQVGKLKDNALTAWSPFTVNLELAEFFPAFTAVSTCFTEVLTKYNLSVVVKVSILVGFFGLLCGIVTRVFRSNSSSRNSDSHK